MFSEHGDLTDGRLVATGRGRVF